VTTARPLILSAGRLVAGALALVGLVALSVTALDADRWARTQLVLNFDESPRQPGAAVNVATANLRLAAATLIAAWAVRQCPRLGLFLDVALGLVAALNLAIVGLALGGYGVRLLGSVALHGPVELAAFALCGSAYLAARQRALTGRRLATAGGLAAALLALAAITETYLQLGAAR
jgi:hypothetical protein